MIYEVFYESFIRVLSALIPDKKDLVNLVSQKLHLDKRAASRRIQGEYQFRINEVIQLCSLLDISLDQIILRNKMEYTPSQIAYYPFDNMTAKEYGTMRKYLDKYRAASKEVGSYALFSCNVLPDFFCFQYHNLLRLYKLKWAYYMADLSEKNDPLPNPVIDPAHLELLQEYVTTIKGFENLLIVWDYNIIPSIIKDIEYFTHTGYLLPEFKERLKEELFLVIDQIDYLCKNHTSLEETRNFTFAVSRTHLKKTHSLFKGEDLKIAVDSAFYATYLYVEDPRIVEAVEHIILATLKSSVIISHSNDSERMKFIAEQKNSWKKFKHPSNRLPVPYDFFCTKRR